MKKKIRAFALSCLCLGSFAAQSPLFAFDGDNFCFENDDFCYEQGSCSTFSSVYVEGEYLFLKPCVDDLDWALKSSQDIVTCAPEGEGKIESFDPGWKSAFRLTLGKDCLLGNWGIAIEYLYFKGEESNSLCRPECGSLSPTLIHLGNVSEKNIFNPEKAHGKWSLRFQTFDILLNHLILCNECYLFNPYFGVEGLIINQMIKSEFFECVETMNSRWESDFFGVGLIIGGRFDWRFCSCLGFFADASARIIRGDADMDDHFRIDVNNCHNQDFKLRYEECLFVPGYRINVGLSYSQEFCGKVVSIDAGYEFMSFFHLPNPRRYVTGGEGLPISTSPTTSALGFHGAFLSMKFSF